MKNNSFRILGALTADLLLCAGIQTLSAGAAGTLVTQTDGTVNYLENGRVQTGLITAVKDYVLGDVGGDDAVNSTDAANILYAAAAAGADGLMPSELLAAENAFLPDAQTALQYADVNEDGSIDAADAAGILHYAASSGTDPDTLPLGTAFYLADENGALFKGFVKDRNGRIYYADDSYRLHTGWLTVDGTRYYCGKNAEILTGWQTFGSSRYYFNADGAMLTGLQSIDSQKYYFTDSGAMHTGWLELDGKKHYFNAEGRMLFGWHTIDGNRYHFNANGIMYTGLVSMIDGQYYFSNEGIMQTGVQVIGGVPHLFDENGRMCTGWLSIDNDTYYYREDGALHTGWLETDDGDYYFSADGKMVTGFTDLGSGMVYFEPDGRYYGRCRDITSQKTEILENAELNPHDSYIIWNRQVTPEKEYMTIRLKEKDIAILEEFAAEHFTEDMTMAQKLWVTQQWIHKKVDYAYAGSKWDSIVNLSYVEAIFVNRMGQCVQYNGAMAAMMIWFGYDVYMVKGWTDSGNQHFWTEVVIDGKTYLMECGNYGKNGNWQDFLEPLS